MPPARGISSASLSSATSSSTTAMSSASSSGIGGGVAAVVLPLIKCPDCGQTVRRFFSQTPAHTNIFFYKCMNHNVSDFWHLLLMHLCCCLNLFMVLYAFLNSQRKVVVISGIGSSHMFCIWWNMVIWEGMSIKQGRGMANSLGKGMANNLDIFWCKRKGLKRWEDQ